VESFTLSGQPQITGLFYNGILLQEDLTISSNTSGSVILNGYMFNHTENVLFSTNNESVYNSLTTITGFTNQDDISGEIIPFEILNDNILLLDTPSISSGNIRLIPFNRAGYDFSDLSYTDTLCGRGLSSTFIIVE
jgi:hypothetical protein